MSGNYTVPGAAPAGAAPASGYYSRPDLWTDAQKHQDDVEASYLRLKHLEGGLQTQTKNIEGMTNSLRFLQRRFQLAEKAGDTAQMESIKLHYDEVYSQLRRADLAYAKSYRDYKQAYSGYQTAWNAQNTYMTAQEEAEKQWRSTIRDSATVGAELQQVQEQLRKLTQQDSTGRILTGLGNWAQNVLASSSGFAVPGQEYTPQNAKQIAELEAREKLLKEEYQWGLQFEDEALRNSEKFKTLSQQGLEKWQQMRAQQAQLKGKSALEHNAAAYAAANENPFVTAFNQVVQQYREDDSYQQPNEKWSQEQLDRFGYLLMTETAKAWEYAEQVNNQISQEKAQEQKDAIAQKATASGWAGVGHTIGALATAPLALADVMDNLAEFAGRGTVTSKDSVTPYDYSQAVVGGISKKLNEAGTIDESVPVIGGKGWGDLYSIGFSVAQSLIAGKVTKVAGTGALTLLQFMGQGAAVGVDSGLESGASGTRALAYGLISGAAEGFAEQIGVDNLMKLGSARTFKGFVKNLLKQSAAEGIEETVTAVLDSAADRIILGENSTFRKAVSEYEQSMSHEDAVRLAWTETIGGIVFDGLSGAISGGLGAGVTTTGANVAESIRDHRQAKPTATESVPQGAAEVPAAAAPATFQEENQRQMIEHMTAVNPAQGATAQLAGPEYTQNDGGMTNGAEDAGDSVSNGGGQRDVGAGAGEQAGQLDGGTKAQQKREAFDQQRARLDRQTRIRNLRLQKISSQELGIPNGTEAKTFSVVPQEHWDAEMSALDSRIYQETGRHMTFVSGRMQVTTRNGVGTVSGVFMGDQIVVQVDSMKASMEQLADHEAIHAKLADDRRGILRQQLRDRLTEQHSEEEFRRVAEKYVLAMDGVYGDAEGDDGALNEAVMRRIEEEVYADAYAGINSFGANASRFSESVRAVMAEYDHGRRPQQSNGVRQTNGPPAQNESSTGEGGAMYAIESLPDGRKYVRADRQVIFGSDPEAWANQVEDYINGKIRRGEDVPVIAENGDVLKLTSDTAGKLADNHSGHGTTLDDEKFYVKANAAVHIDELAKISENANHGQGPKADKGARHGAFAEGGWTYRTAYFHDFDGKHYRLTISVAKGVDGNVVYNIGNIEERSFPKIVGPSAKGGALNGETSFEKIVPQTASDVKPAFSYDGDTAEADANEKAQAKAATEALRKDRTKNAGLNAEQAAMLEQIPEVRKTRLSKLKPVAESKPILAKGQLKTSIREVFQIPEGSVAGVNEMLDHFADRMIQKEAVTDGDLQSLLDKLIDAGVATVAADEYTAEASRIIRKGRIYVAPSLRQDFGDDYDDLKRRAFAAGVYLTSNYGDASVDMWNHDLAQELPGLFDSEATDEREILERIIQIAEEGRDEKMSLRDYAAMLAQNGEIRSEEDFLRHMEQQLAHLLDTFGKAAEIEIKLRDRTGKKIAQERDIAAQRAARKQALEEQRRMQERKERLLRQRQRKQLQELQQKTLKQLKWLNKNRRALGDDLLAGLDEEGQRIFRDVVSDLDMYAVGAADAMRWSGKYQCTWVDAVEMYDKAKAEDPNFFESAELERMAIRLRGKKLDSLSIEDLSSVYKLLTGLRTAYYNKRNLIQDEFHRAIADVYEDSVDEIRSAKLGKLKGKLDKFLNLEQLTPMNIFQRMGGWNPKGAFYSMGRMLEQGERAKRAFEVTAKSGELAQFLQDNEDWVKKSDGQGKDGIWYEVEIPRLVALERGKPPVFEGSVKVWMTPAQKVHLYLESKNQDNLRHMVGGRTFADKALYSKGERADAFARGTTVCMAPETVRAIVADMTDTELELARILERFYNETAKKEINRVSNILYGYDKAMGSYYAPIFCDGNYTKHEFGVFDVTAEGVGNLKGRQVSKNPSYNISALDAFERNVEQTARFVGMAIPVRNWSAFHNWGGKDASIRKVISSQGGDQWGSKLNKYIEDLVDRLQGGESYETDTISSTADRLLSNGVSAIFGFNPSIVLKQVGSLALASPYLGWNNFPAPKKWRVDVDLIAKYTKELQWRTMGYATPETKLLKENPGIMQTNRVLNFLTGGAITWTDGGTAGLLWPWAENKVRQEQPDIAIGTAEQVEQGESPFYKAVAKEFNDAVSRSQSVSDEMHQGRLRKSKNLATRAFTMFRSDSAQAYNAIRQKVGEAAYYKRTGATQQVQDAAVKSVGAVVGAMIVNALWGELIDLAMAAIKNGAKYYRDDDDELTADSVGAEMLRGMGGSLAGIIIGGDAVYEAFGAAFMGDADYDFEAPGLEQINAIKTAAINLGKNIAVYWKGAKEVSKAGGSVGQYWKENADGIAGCVKDAAQVVATYFGGIPTANVEKYLLGIVSCISPELGQAYKGLFEDTGKSDLPTLSGKALKARVKDLLKERNIFQSEECADVLTKLYEAGYKDVIPSDIQQQMSVNGEDRELDAGQRQKFANDWAEIVRDSLDALVKSERFSRAGQKAQAKMISYLYSYAGEIAKGNLFDDYEPSTRDETVEAFADAGMDMTDFLYCYANYNEIYNSDLSATEKATKFAHWLDGVDFSETEKSVIRDELVFYNMSPASANRYEGLVSAGLEKDDALELTAALAELVPEEGDLKVTDVQRWRTCVDFATHEGVQLSALSSVMKPEQYLKVSTAYSLGISPDAYVKYYEIRVKFDADKNGAYTQAEVKKAIDSMGQGMTTKQKAVLWQVVSGAGSAKNNPYSVEAGQKLLDMLKKKTGSKTG